MKKTYVALGMAAAVSLAACNNGGGDGSGNPPTTPTPPGAASIPLVALVNQMFAATNETSSPIEINNLPIDTSDDTPGIYNSLII